MVRYLIKVTISKNFYKRVVFLLLLKTKVHANLKKYIDRHEVLFKTTTVLSILPSFLYQYSNKPISQVNCSTLTFLLCVVITVLLSVILVFNTIFIIFKVIPVTIYFFLFFAPCRHHQPMQSS